MPLEHGAGYSAKATPQKQQDFTYVLGVYLANIARCIFDKHSWAVKEWLYLDLTAGPGQYEALGGFLGSPLIFLDLASLQAFPSRALFFEQTGEAATLLQQAIEERIRGAHIDWEVINADHAVAIPEVLSRPDLMARAGQRFGLAYIDTNSERPDPSPLQCISRQFRYVDLLLNVSANNGWKRSRGASYSDVFLEDDIKRYGKKYWYIREPIGAEQWTMLFGTNWQYAPSMSGARFVLLESDAGRQWLDILNLSVRERQARLPLGSPRPTVVTPSISVIPDSAPSVPKLWPVQADNANAVACDHQPSHIISDTHPGAPSTCPPISSQSAIRVTVPFTANHHDGTICLACDLAEVGGDVLVGAHLLTQRDPNWACCTSCGVNVVELLARIHGAGSEIYNRELSWLVVERYVHDGAVQCRICRATGGAAVLGEG